MIGAALQGEKDLVKGGNLSLGETAEIKIDVNIQQKLSIKEIFGQAESIQVSYIDKNYKLINSDLVDKPSALTLIDRNGLKHLWEHL